MRNFEFTLVDGLPVNNQPLAEMVTQTTQSVPRAELHDVGDPAGVVAIAGLSAVVVAVAAANLLRKR